MINGDDNGDYIRGITGIPEKSGHSANDKFVLRQRRLLKHTVVFLRFIMLA